MSTKMSISPAKVLVLETQDHWRDHTKEVLKGYPFEVTFTRTPEEVLQVVAGQDFDVLVVCGDCALEEAFEVSAEIVSFVEEIGQRFPALPIVADSSDYRFGEGLQRSGCEHYTVRAHLADKLHELLKLD